MSTQPDVKKSGTHENKHYVTAGVQSTPRTADRIETGKTRPVYFLWIVIPGQSSVRKGEAGNPAPLYRLQTGLLAHA